MIDMDPSYGYVVGCAAASYLIHHVYMSLAVGKARKKYSVPYPNMYADKENKDAHAFNCVQRGHQNCLENLAGFHTLLLLAGARYPIAAAVSGAVYLVGRVRYFQGYCESPKGRYKGMFLHFGALALLGMTCAWAVELVRSG